MRSAGGGGPAKAKVKAKAKGQPAAAVEIPGLPARQVAAAAISDALAGHAVFDEETIGRAGLPPADAALARAIAVTTFRRLGTIGRVLTARLPKGPPKEERGLAILATGAAQILFLDVPDHAAVDLAVHVARADSRTAHLGGLVNAVLRRIVRERDELLAAPAAPEIDLPDWLAARWTRIYGPERTRAFAAAHLAGAPLDLSVKAEAAAWAERLGAALLPNGSVRIADRTAVEDLPGFAEGAWWVQDAAASLPALLLAPQPGERILDFCAAPGGKTAQLAAAGAAVTALDRSAPRLRRLAANMTRLGLDVTAVAADGLAWTAERFDAVLLDAPCTGTGTLRRHPDIGWTKGPKDLASLVALQRGLLDRAADLVRPGGRLVYCTCSLEPEEGEDQARALLARRPDLERVTVDAAALGFGPEVLTSDGDLRTAPDLWPAPAGERGGLDGFFAARFRKCDPGPAQG